MGSIYIIESLDVGSKIGGGRDKTDKTRTEYKQTVANIIETNQNKTARVQSTRHREIVVR